ncbi:Fe-S oxidoreductase [Homoserinibacter sp. GY 40078]|nr:Fe-S oxidoreductase [Homoserinibacter sp. GY 40078]
MRGVTRIPGCRRLLLSRPVAATGFGIATALAFLWGTVLFGRHRRAPGVHVIAGLPRWSFGRGGTTIGAVYLTRDVTSDRVLTHEAVHVTQWRHYGLSLPILYLAAGSEARTNRFEIEAGLVDGGYLPG